jgi:peptidoglycan/xylan/chitin deacetylase (PgdA/CDA1 family)
MDDGPTALRNPFRAGSEQSPRLARRPSLEPHHRRRRTLALGLLAGAALVLGAIAGAGGGPAVHPVAKLAPGFFARIQTLAGTGQGSFTAAEKAAENAAIDRTLAFTPYVRVAGAQHKEMALTFDDGPGPYTPQVLSVLERKHAPATFFEVGVEERYFHASTSQIVADGYPIGDHTQAHAPMSKLSPADQQSQLVQQISSMGAYGATFPRMFRPPYGLFNAATLKLLKKYRMLMVLWTIDTSDYRQPGVSAIVTSVLSGARPGAIVLMHDAGGARTETVAALPRIISGLRARGYKLVTVPRLLLDNPPPDNQQITSLLGSGG